MFVFTTAPYLTSPSSELRHAHASRRGVRKSAGSAGLSHFGRKARIRQGAAKIAGGTKERAAPGALASVWILAPQVLDDRAHLRSAQKLYAVHVTH